MLSKEEIMRLLETAIKEALRDRWEKRAENVYAKVPSCQLCDAMSDILEIYPTSTCQPCPMIGAESKCSKGWNIWVMALTIQKKKEAARIIIQELKDINIGKTADVILSTMREEERNEGTTSA